MAKSRNVLKTSNSAELLSYIINSNPVLSADIDLPVQGQDIREIGKVIVNNQRYRNAFINTVNLIGLTVIKRNGWENPWDFTKRGTLRFGQTVREIVNDLANVYQYNEFVEDVDRFLETEVPNVYNYLHDINFQVFYETTTSDEQLAMAFDSESSLMEFIDNSIGMLYESLKYDEFLVDKYQLCRRIVDGTITPSYINISGRDVRDIVADMKAVSNKMSFRSPNYNPAGIRRATSFEDQIMILNCEYDALISTNVLATSFFRNDAEFKTQLKLIDSFSDTDTLRLAQVLKNEYTAFTDDEITALGNVLGAIVSREWFMNYDYVLDNATEIGEDGGEYRRDLGYRYTEFFNPTSLRANHFLHYWGVKSTSPFENATVFTSVQPSVTSVTISPDTVTLNPGLSTQLTATVVTTGFANKAVTWSSSDETVCKVDINGVITIPADATPADTATITATSVYDTTKTDTATITVAGTALETNN